MSSLGQTAESVWATYLAVVKAALDLIYAVMKGQTSVIGAIYNAETGAVTTLGAHLDLLVLAGQHILGVPDAHRRPRGGPRPRKRRPNSPRPLKPRPKPRKQPTRRRKRITPPPRPDTKPPAKAAAPVPWSLSCSSWP